MNMKSKDRVSTLRRVERAAIINLSSILGQILEKWLQDADPRECGALIVRANQLLNLSAAHASAKAKRGKWNK